MEFGAVTATTTSHAEATGRLADLLHPGTLGECDGFIEEMIQKRISAAAWLDWLDELGVIKRPSWESESDRLSLACSVADCLRYTHDKGEDLYEHLVDVIETELWPDMIPDPQRDPVSADE